ncbi:MAG: YtxH domain-containing protein [Bacteroidetes bacterium]|nr:YtxH domain-containing protein [Bacteroidota bacterium]
MKNSGNILGALLIGVAAGAVIGILVAPDKGSETRKKLLNGANDLGDNLKDKIAMGKKKLRSIGMNEDEKEFYENVHSASNPV